MPSSLHASCCKKKHNWTSLGSLSQQSVWSYLYRKLSKKFILSCLISICRKCDKVDCRLDSLDSPIWRVFTGCGHSFHVQCNLPNISTCPICLSYLNARIVTLSSTATDAIKNPSADRENDDSEDAESDDDDEESDEDEDETDDSDDADDGGSSSSRVDKLIHAISSWQRAAIPLN